MRSDESTIVDMVGLVDIHTSEHVAEVPRHVLAKNFVLAVSLRLSSDVRLGDRGCLRVGSRARHRRIARARVWSCARMDREAYDRSGHLRALAAGFTQDAGCGRSESIVVR